MQKFLNQGISVIPIKKGTKEPYLKSWKKHQQERLKEWTFDDVNIAMIGGAVSSNLECLDFDNKLNNADVIISDFCDFDGVQDILDKHSIPIQNTPSGGFHIIYKCDEPIDGSMKLARDINPQTDKPEVLIETRGEGGYFLVDPSEGYKCMSSLDDIPTIKKSERDFLISVAKSLNKYNGKPQGQNRRANREPIQERAGDAYNADPKSISESINILRNNGWTSTNDKHWVRPNKSRKDGISATLGVVADGMFYVFSSNAHPFEDGQGYYPYAIKTMLEYQGDYGACAKALSKEGYGYDPNRARKLVDEAVKDAANKGFRLSPNEIADLSIELKTPIEAIQEQVKSVESNVDVKDPKKEKKKPIPKSKLTAEFIKEKYDIRYNEVANKVEFKLKEDDEYMDMNHADIITNAGYHDLDITNSNVKNAVNSVYVHDKYNPFLEKLESLPDWDGEDRLKPLFQCLKLTHNEHYDFFESMFIKSLVRTVKCALDDYYYNRMVFTLISPKQEIGKSYFMRWLNPMGDQYYNESPIDNNKDSLIAYARNFIYNIDDLDDMDKRGLGKVKSIISISSVNVRPPYGEQSIDMPRRCSFWATTNKRDFLSDVTNSRWICCDVDDIDRGYSSNIDKDQLWAQIYKMYKNDFDCELTSEEKIIRERINSTFTEETDETSIFVELFLKSNKFMSNAEIFNTVAKFTPIKNPSTHKNGKALAMLGFESVIRSGKRGWLIDVNPDKKPF